MMNRQSRGVTAEQLQVPLFRSNSIEVAESAFHTNEMSE